MTAYNHFKITKLSKVENSGIDTSSAIDVFYLNYLRSLVIFSGAWPYSSNKPSYKIFVTSNYGT